jgi:uncharacterized protein (TIGR03435 family)
MLRRVALAALATGLSYAQLPRFETAAIHPASPAESGGSSGCNTTAAFMRCTNVTLKRLIAGAYDVVGQERVLGGPDWADTDRFDIVARSDQPVGDKGLMAMLQTLLAERFNVALHRETRSAEAMVLEVGKNGPKIHPAGVGRPSWNNEHDHLRASGITMADLSGILSRDLKLPVVNSTGLVGAYSFTLRWDPQAADDANRDEWLSVLRAEMSAAIARELGLTLKFRKIPVEVIVIDRAGKPSGND